MKGTVKWCLIFLSGFTTTQHCGCARYLDNSVIFSPGVIYVGCDFCDLEICERRNTFHFFVEMFAVHDDLAFNSITYEANHVIGMFVEIIGTIQRRKKKS
jgi:hypothetical protein